jgi:hypothetical protein
MPLMKIASADTYRFNLQNNIIIICNWAINLL